MSTSNVRTIRSNDRLMDELGTIVKDYNRKTRRFSGATIDPDEIYKGLKDRLSKKAKARVLMYSVAHKVLPKRVADYLGDRVYSLFKDKDPVDNIVEDGKTSTVEFFMDPDIESSRDFLVEQKIKDNTARSIRETNKLMDELGKIVSTYRERIKTVYGVTSTPEEVCDGLRGMLSRGARARVFLYDVAHKVLPAKMADIVGYAIYEFPSKARVFTYGVARKVLPKKMAKVVGRAVYSVLGPRRKPVSLPTTEFPCSVAPMESPKKEEY